MSDSTKKQNKSEPAEFKYYCNFHVSIPSWPESIEADQKQLADVIDIVADALQSHAAKHPGLQLEQTAGWIQITPTTIPLIDKKDG